MAVRRVKQALGAQVRPEELAGEALAKPAGADQQETDRQMETMWGALSSAGTLPVMRAVMNPRCFGQTVENLFTLSFLVRDQRVRMFHDAAGALAVEVLSRAATAATAKTHREAVQFVVALETVDWVRFLPPCRAALRAMRLGARRRRETTDALAAKNGQNIPPPPHTQERMRSAVRPEDCLMQHRESS